MSRFGLPSTSSTDKTLNVLTEFASKLVITVVAEVAEDFDITYESDPLSLVDTLGLLD